MEGARNVLTQLKAFWANLPTPKRWALVLLTAGVLIAVSAISVIGSRVQYAYLYTGLEPQDAAGIVEKLKTLQVPYRLEAGGSALQVPEDRVAALRLELAASGLPRGAGVGFEIFDKSQIGATEFEQQVSLRRALEGELSRSMMTVDGVQAARVHLVMPERRLFVARDELASASVVLKLANAGAFGRKEVAAIVHLVAAAVPGLSRDRVSVVSTEGVTLHRPNVDGQPDVAAATDLQAERARALAAQMENDVRAQVERIVGPGNADVRIHLELDASVREQTEELYNPEKTALRSEQQSEELTGAGDPGVAGVPGALSNLPDTQGQGEATQQTTEAKAGGIIRRSHTRNWEVDRVLRKTSTPPGAIAKLSAAVLINGKYVQKGDQQVYVPRTAEELATVEDLVKRAVGYSEERSDSISVSSAEFARLHQDLPPEAPLPFHRQWLTEILMAAGALALLSLLVLAYRTSRTKQQARAAAALEAAKLAQAAAALPEGVSDGRLLERQAADTAELRAKALQAASDDPATAAVVLRKWLNAPSAASPSARS